MAYWNCSGSNKKFVPLSIAPPRRSGRAKRKNSLARRSLYEPLHDTTTPLLHRSIHRNLSGENGVDLLSAPPSKSSAANSPTAELVVMPWPPRPATQKKFFTSGSQPIMNRPSGVKVLNPAQPLAMLTKESPGMNCPIFSASFSNDKPSTGGSPGASSV